MLVDSSPMMVTTRVTPPATLRRATRCQDELGFHMKSATMAA